MAEFSSPISGGLRVARSRVSSSVFASSIGPDPATKTLLNQNQSALTAISSQLGAMDQKMRDFSGALERIAVGIANDSLLDKQRENQKINQERILAEQQLREGKESVVERKIQSALIEPVQKVAAKAQFTLSRLMGFFTTLLGGWLINQGIETIKALSEGNTKKLEQIRDNVLRNLGIIGGIYLAIKTGLSGIVNIARSVTRKVAGGVVKGLFVRPFQALINAVKGGASSAASTASKAGGGLMSGIARGAKNIAGRMLGPGITGAALTGLDIAGGEDPGRAAAGAAGGMISSTGAFLLGSAIPLPGTGLLAGSLAYGPGQDYGKDIYDKIFGRKTEDNQAEQNKKTSEPTLKMTPSASDFRMGDKSQTEKSNQEASEQDFSQPPAYGSFNISSLDAKSGESAEATADGITPSSASSSTMPQAVIAPFKVESYQTQAQRVGPLPEPPPTIIPAPSVPSPSPAPSGPGGSNRPSNNVPFFATSNPDNFYTLYSQVHYNVVM